MIKFIIQILTILFFSSFALAQTLVPATSEDLNDFDKQVLQAQKAQQAREIQKSQPKSNFGSAVSAEAKKIKDSDLSHKKDMGQWVSDQRRKDDQKSAASSENEDSDKDAKTSSPQNADHGNSANAPGHSGTHGNSGK